jgi:23S rRNA pseudouridine1911/1915/1917 synthase
MTRQALHAHRLRFTHPRTKQLVEAVAPLPDQFRQALDALRENRGERRR